MKSKALLIGALLLGCTVLPIAAVFAIEAYRSRGLSADIVARAPERGNFHPRSFTVTSGQEVRLRIRNVDTVTHGFAFPDLGVELEAIPAGHVEYLEFEAPGRGRYPFYCTVWCSEHHLKMRGVMKVLNP